MMIITQTNERSTSVDVPMATPLESAPLTSAAASRGRPFEEHPTVRLVRGRPPAVAELLGLEDLRRMALAAGADDVGVVSLDHPELVEERPFIERALPGTRTLVALVLRMHPDNVQSPQRSVANREFHRTGHETDEVAHRLAVALSARGHRAINPSMAFPMEVDHFPGRTWIVSHKRVAVAAQVGKMGLHRSVIHPRFGSFILLGTVLTSAEVGRRAAPLEFNPCVDCKLCVAACPVGAIEPEGAFRFSACYDHNYREFMTGFGDFVEEVADSGSRGELRKRVSPSETASMWQSLAYGPNYKAAYCIAVCPAGEELLGPFLRDRASHLQQVVRPLTQRTEPVYVVAGSDAEEHVRRRFPHKPVRLVRSSLGATSAAAFFKALPLVFQRRPARGLRATYHFQLTGEPPTSVTVQIDDGALQIHDGLVGSADVEVSGSGQVWLEVPTKQRSPVWAVLSRRLRVRGPRALLGRFAPASRGSFDGWAALRRLEPAAATGRSLAVTEARRRSRSVATGESHR
jgi:epoxyqueuosine reductase QueG